MEYDARLFMKADQKMWWRAWAPYWEFMEDQHLGRRHAELLMDSMVQPVLVVGAGQGLIVEALRRRNIATDGLDLDREMVGEALSRRGQNLLLGDARFIPIRSGAYNTVLIATGVVDYIEDEGLALDILRECRRVLSPDGNLLVSFYQIVPAVERAYRRIGVVTEDNVFRLARIFELFKTMKSPFACAGQVSRFTGKNAFFAFCTWTWLGITLPSEMKEEQRTIDRVVETAQRDGVLRDDLFDNTPDNLPYRKEADILALMERAALLNPDVIRSEDCLTVKCSSVGGA